MTFSKMVFLRQKKLQLYDIFCAFVFSCLTGQYLEFYFHIGIEGSRGNAFKNIITYVMGHT